MYNVPFFGHFFLSFLVTIQATTTAVTSVITRAFHQNGKILIKIKNACIIRMLGGLKVITYKSHDELSQSWQPTMFTLGPEFKKMKVYETKQYYKTQLVYFLPTI